MDMVRLLPGGLRHPGDLAVVGELAQTDAAHPELAIHRARPAAARASSIGLRFVLRWAQLFDALGGLGHQSVLSFSVFSASGSLSAAASGSAGCSCSSACSSPSACSASGCVSVSTPASGSAGAPPPRADSVP